MNGDCTMSSDQTPNHPLSLAEQDDIPIPQKTLGGIENNIENKHQGPDHSPSSPEAEKGDESIAEANESVPFFGKMMVVAVLMSIVTTLVLSLAAVWIFVHLRAHQSYDWQPASAQSSLALGGAKLLSPRGVTTVLDRNLFNQESSALELDPKDDAEYKGSLRKTRLPLRLVGTVYGSDPYSGIAMIEDTNSKTVTSFVVDSWIAKNVRIHQILRARVVFDNNGIMEYLEQETKELVRRKRGAGSGLSMMSSVSTQMPGPSKGRISEFKEEGYEFSDGKIQMTESYKNKLLTRDFTKVLQDMKADPFMKGKKLVGFKLSRIRKDSIYEKAGLADGDIVTEINGVELTSVSQAISVLQAARNSNRLEATIIQDGQPQTVEISIGQ